MSGGSMNYFYQKFDYDARFTENTPLRKAFAEHLTLVAKALHDIEWVDSADYSGGDENEAIRACLGTNEVPMIQKVLLKQVEQLKLEVADLERRIRADS